LAFKELLKHPDARVVKSVQARLATKSALIENRSERLLRRVGLPTPMYYNYWAARTGRWGGGDSVNWQNLSKKGDGAELRSSLTAPNGMSMIIADASQIEARMAAWLADDTEMLDAFARGDDTYAIAATGVYGFPVNKNDHPDERFGGKVLSLSCQYGAGGVKVANVFRLGNMGPAIDMSVTEAKELVSKWRLARHKLTALWKTLERAAETAWLGGQVVEVGPLAFEKHRNNGYMHLPNGTYVIYREVDWDPNSGRMYYNSRNGNVTIWGGYLLENAAQALCCVLLKQQMLHIMDAIEDLRIVSTTHDEMVNLVFTEDAKQHAATVKRIMSTPEEWAQGIPLDADVYVSQVYDKA
jgi:DNA polymerase